MEYARIRREELTDAFCSRLIKAINKQTLDDIAHPHTLEKKWERDSIKDFDFLKKLNTLRGGIYNE